MSNPRKKHHKVPIELKQAVKEYFLRTGCTMTTLMEVFKISRDVANKVTDSALKETQEIIKKSDPHKHLKF